MRPSVLIALLAAAAVPAIASAAPTPVYAAGTTIAGPDGSWDYAQIDDEGTHLYIARSGSATMIDLVTGAVSSVGSIDHGHAVIPFAKDQLMVTSGHDDSVRLIDLASGKETAKIAVGKDPDAAILDSSKTHAYVMNAKAGTVSVIDLATAKVTKTITVKPALEYAAFGSDGTLFINNEDANEINTVDVAAGMAGKSIAIPGCKAPTGLAFDKAGNRLIAACANGKAAIVDAGKKQMTALIDIGMGPDAVLLDAARGLAFIPCGRAGVLEVLSLSDATVMKVATIKTEVGARTGALDPKTGAIYLPTAKFGPPAKAGGWPTMMPGSFHVLVVRPA